MVKEIPLQNGMVALVDDEDYERVMEHVWTASAARTNLEASAKIDGKTIELKKFILNMTEVCGRNKKIVSLDKNSLNAQKSNLKVLDAKLANHTNRSKRGSTSKYKGVHYHKGARKWVAQIKSGEKHEYIGLFECEDDAAQAYNEKAKELHGDFAYLNIIGIDNRADIPTFEGAKIRRVNGANPSSKYRGVTYCKRDKGYYAQCTKNKKVWRRFFRDSEEEAARAYDKKALELHGDKAILNFPEEKED